MKTITKTAFLLALSVVLAFLSGCAAIDKLGASFESDASRNTRIAESKKAEENAIVALNNAKAVETYFLAEADQFRSGEKEVKFTPQAQAKLIELRTIMQNAASESQDTDRRKWLMAAAETLRKDIDLVANG
ncbi:MAG: hypothetical protein KDD44_13025, partial [Bdellovibrionales bacterium]|nr:hypothetical protein [Bdellovibrionales bacterium]